MCAYFRALIVCFLLITSDRALGQVGFLDPGWGDPAFSDYLDRAGGRVLGDDGLGRAIVGISASLPILGFPEIEGESADRSALGTDFDPAAFVEDIPDWPACASPTPEIKNVGDETGAWYVRNLDFGCVQMIIEGDRTAPPPQFSGRSLEDSGTIEVTVYDENAGVPIDAEGRSDILTVDPAEIPPGTAGASIVLGNLVYGLQVSCVDPTAYALCRNTEASRRIAGKLRVVGGAPDF
ncbi:hypothetical protein [Paracoccus sp. 22332]|uniref:hypothetical protein n=1 Tax=Paracoccus sp. 22332 TaxID=3453913 RepID=UPI003F835BC6